MTFDTIRLDKSFYASGKGFTSALEEVDPSSEYKGTSLEGMDAYQRQLKRFGIKVSGKNSDPIEKFFRSGDSAALFPEYVSRAVAQGMDEGEILSKIVATTTVIDGLDYRTITPGIGKDVAAGEVAEGGQIPETLISTQDNLVTLNKHGRILSASYEAIRLQKLDLFTVALRQIGAAISRAQIADAVDVLMNGDGNNNAITTVHTETGGTLTYGDLVDFWNSFAPYNLTTILASPDMLAQILKLPEFRDAYTGLDFHSTGKLVTPFGAELYRVSAVPEGTLIGLDKSCALERVQSGAVVTEADKLIDRQLERTAITATTGFAKIFKDASKALSI